MFDVYEMNVFWQRIVEESSSISKNFIEFGSFSLSLSLVRLDVWRLMLLSVRVHCNWPMGRMNNDRDRIEFVYRIVGIDLGDVVFFWDICI